MSETVLTHSMLPPSRAARRVECPGSRGLEAFYHTDEESAAAREGTAAHWLAAGLLKNEFSSMPEEDSKRTKITVEMIEGASLYVDFIKSLNKENNTLHIEERVDIHSIHIQCFGTPDCWFYDSVRNELFIIDYKFGHTPVEAFENWQLIEYAAGIIDNYISTKKDLQINFHIVQPRGYHKDGRTRTWSVSYNCLTLYFDRLKVKEHESMSENPRFKPGAHCMHCVGRHACSALQRTSLAIGDSIREYTHHELSAHEMGHELRFLSNAADILEARITGLSAQVAHKIQQGERVPYFRVEAGNGRDKWKNNDDAIIMGEMLGLDIKKPQEPVTPKQAIKMGVPEEIVSMYSEHLKGALKLIRDNGETARKIFGGSNENAKDINGRG